MLAVGDLELALHRTPARVHITNKPRPAELVHQLPTGLARGVAVRDEPDELAFLAWELDALALERQQEAFEAAAKPDARRRPAAELLDEVVVSAAAADGVLRAQAASRHL